MDILLQQESLSHLHEYTELKSLRSISDLFQPLLSRTSSSDTGDNLNNARRDVGTDIDGLRRKTVEVAQSLYLWRGDITRLKCDVIVNAANRG